MNVKITNIYFKKLRQKGKQSCYSSLIEKYKNNSMKTWEIMKEINGKIKIKSNDLPKILQTKEGFMIKNK